MTKIKNVKRGDTCVLEATVTDPDTGAVVDLTGYSAFLTVKAAPSATDNTNDDATAAVVNITQNPIEGDPTTGVVTFTIPATTMTAVTPGTYYYDVQVISPSGAVYSSNQDQFIVVTDTTRRVS